MGIKKRVVDELADLPEEFFPLLFEQIRAYKQIIKIRKKSKMSPVKRLLKLAGSLENPEGLSAREFKKRTIEGCSFFLPVTLFIPFTF
jgi:hypothetical protein